MLSSLLTLALAAPSVDVTAEGVVRGEVVVSTPPEQVMERMKASASRAKAMASTAKITAEPAGDCELEHVFVANAIKDVRYDIRTCATDMKVHSTLVSSDDFTDFVATWRFAPADGGTKITYDLTMVPSFYVPGFVIKAQAKKGVLEALQGIEKTFGGA